MSTSGRAKWEKYFKGRAKVDTVIVTGKSESVKIFNFLGDEIGELQDATPISVLPLTEYSTKYLVQTSDQMGYVSEKHIAKPLNKATRATFTAINFASLGRKTHIMYNGRSVHVLEFSNVRQIEDSILAGLDQIEKSKEKTYKTFEDFFRAGYDQLHWSSDLDHAMISKYGIYISELLIGSYLLQNKLEVFDIPMSDAKAIRFYLPIDPAFSGVDSLVLLEDGRWLPISSKFGGGSKASIFSNLMETGLKEFADLKQSVFKDMCQVALFCGITPEDLAAKKKGKHIVYAYGAWNLLGIDRDELSLPIKAFTDYKMGIGESPDTLKVLESITKSDRLTSQIAEKLPLSMTAFFTRGIADALNRDTESLSTMLDILSVKDYWQASMNVNMWQSGLIKFTMTQSKKSAIKIIGNKSAIADIDAKQGMVNFALTTRS